VRQLIPCGIGILLSEIRLSPSRSRTCRRRTGKPLFVDYTLLYWMQRPIRIGQPFDGHDFLVADSMCEHGARIVRNIIKQNRAGATFGAVPAEFGAGKTELIAHVQASGLLLHYIDASLLTVNIQRDEPFTDTACGSANTEDARNK